MGRDLNWMNCHGEKKNYRNEKISEITTIPIKVHKYLFKRFDFWNFEYLTITENKHLHKKPQHNNPFDRTGGVYSFH